MEGAAVRFVGSAHDDEDGGLSPMIDWSSTIDGTLGTGPTLTVVLSVGSHVVRASVTDSDGSGNSAAVDVTVVADQPPTVTIVDPPDGTVIAQGSAITLRGTASDPEQGTLSTSIVWSSNTDGALGAGETLQVILSVGTHRITAVVTDSKGQSAQSSISVTVLADQPPTIGITAPADGSTTDAGTILTLTAAAFDPEDGTLSDAIAWSSDLDGDLGTGATLQVDLTVGTHVVTARVGDSMGQSAQDQISVTVVPAAAPPTILASSFPAFGSSSELYRVEVSATGQDRRVGPLSTTLGQFPVITDLAEGDGAWYAVSFGILYSLDPNTGLLTFIAGWPTQDVNSLVWDGNGLLLAATVGGMLITIDPSTGTRAPVGPLGGGLFSDGDLTIGPNGKIWGSFLSPAGSVLATVDRTTGAATVVGTTGLTNLWGLAWVGDELFGLTNNAVNGGQLVRLDPATATPVFVRNLSFGASGSGTPSGG